MANEDREDLKKMARELQQQLLPIIKALRKHHINVNISKITGTTTSIVGGIVAVACGIAAPFTLGATVPFAIAGAVVSGVGGGVSAGAALTEFAIERKKNAWHLQNKCRDFFEQFVKTYAISAQREKEWRDWLEGKTSDIVISAAHATGKTAFKGAKATTGLVNGIRNLLRVTRAAEPLLEGGKVAVRGANLVGKVFVVLNAVTLPIDIIDLGIASYRLHKRKGSPATEEFERYIVLLMLVINDEDDTLMQSEVDIREPK
ncbi:uncharacterized protein LOC112553634 [Pomacea canaliculata]|nr:uncharacterized protein LOC112553634 [Pomacea canaliculata]